MENSTQDKSNWLQELSSQSWNLELLVSGVAIFSTSFLPDLIEQAIAYYFENYQAGNELITNIVLPTLAFSFAKASAYLLIITFFVHFILRAFWIAMLGLRAVFPQGINYDNIPNTNSELKETYKKKFGTLDGFLVRLDKICSQIFSIAFILVLFSVMLTVLYLLSFLFNVVLKTYKPELYTNVSYILGITLIIFIVLGLLITFLASKEKYRENPIISKLLKVYISSSTWMYVGMYKPIQYINFVFASNLPRKKYYLSTSILMITMFVFAFSIYIQKLLQHNETPFFESRNFYSSGSSDYRLKSNYYDNQRLGEENVWEASIQADVIQEPFIKLFINYNKVLDANLAKICKEPKMPENLKKFEKRLLKDKANLECLGQYFQIALNDSTLQQVEFFYDQHGVAQTKGLTTYLSSEKCKIGRNTLYIKTLETDSLPKKVWTKYISIPFWYAKD